MPIRRSLSRIRALFLLPPIALVLLGACTQTRFYPYVGPNEQQGKGLAAKHVVNGIDVWTDGVPPRKYQVIGVVEDSRSGFFRDSILKDVTKKAKHMGGQGIIEYQAYAAAANAGVAAASGFSSNAGGLSPQYASGAAMGGAASGALSAAGSGQSRWWVIRYLSKGKKRGESN
ncbi:MAG: hypothetical protein AB7W37_11330 [Syntrophobacteraceae bacterium]